MLRPLDAVPTDDWPWGPDPAEEEEPEDPCPCLVCGALRVKHGFEVCYECTSLGRMPADSC